MLVRAERRAVDRHLEHGRPARHGAATSSRSTDHFVRADHSITRDFASEGMPRARPALPHVGDDLLRGRLRRRGAAASPAAPSTASSTSARTKVPRGAKSPLRDSAVVQTNLAQAEVSIRAARA